MELITGATTTLSRGAPRAASARVAFDSNEVRASCSALAPAACAAVISPSTLTLAATAVSVIWETEMPSSAAICTAVAVALKSATPLSRMSANDTMLR